MFAFFEQIGGFFSTVADYAVSIFENLVSFFQIIFSSFAFLIEICSHLPVPLQAGCLAIIAVAIVYLIVGR